MKPESFIRDIYDDIALYEELTDKDKLEYHKERLGLSHGNGKKKKKKKRIKIKLPIFK